ncbi:MAG: hypothetical protein PWP24_1919 [Clostridiales bacterium]|nr:hypothetical protein [Clostridiales bacterium]
MKKLVAVKAALCIGAVSLLVTGAHGTDITATGVCSETSLAGISLSLEQYVQTVQVKKLAVSGDATLKAKLLDASAETETTTDASVTDTKEVVSDAKAEEAKSAAATEDTKEPEVVKEESKYANMGISVANDYVNIRKDANTESEVLGKLYRGAAATILKTEGDWVKIESGSVKGYIKSEFLAIGYDAEELEDKFGTKWATVNTTTLKVREEPSTDSIVLGLIPIGETYEVLKETDEWVKILVDEGGDGDESTKGFVSKQYVDITVEFEHAISVEEEQAELARQEAAKKAEEDRLKALEEQKKKQSSSSNNASSNSSSSNSSSSNSNSSNSSNSNDSSASSGGTTVADGDGSDIASYAQKFVGNPYVYGGTSLTNGTDCSGFTMSVYSHFGVSIPRTSRSQATAGKSVSFDELKAGDLIVYASNGTVNHVAMYIGGGQVVHASNRKTGIKISTWNYRTPYAARRIVD